MAEDYLYYHKLNMAAGLDPEPSCSTDMVSWQVYAHIEDERVCLEVEFGSQVSLVIWCRDEASLITLIEAVAGARRLDDGEHFTVIFGCATTGGISAEFPAEDYTHMYHHLIDAQRTIYGNAKGSLLVHENVK